MTNFVRNLFSTALLCLMTLGILTPTHSAWAAKAKKKDHQATRSRVRDVEPGEQFKAVDAGQTIGIDNDTNTAFENAPEVSTPPPAPLPPSSISKSALLPKDRGSFERVPDQSKDSIAKRLKIIETLILDYGRAYDYRIHTTQELNSILEDLKKQTPPNNAPQSS